MGKFRIRYGLNGGFGGCEMMDWEEIEANDFDEANLIAYQNACDEYESYLGSNGLRDIDEIIEEDEVDENEAEKILNEDRENWIDYEVEEIKEENKNGI